MWAMSYSKKEILSRFHRAENKDKIITVLADLNACNRAEMIEFLIQNGIAEEEITGKASKKGAIMTDNKVPVPAIVKIAIAEKIERNEKEIERYNKMITEKKLENQELNEFANRLKK